MYQPHTNLFRIQPKNSVFIRFMWDDRRMKLSTIFKAVTFLAPTVGILGVTYYGHKDLNHDKAQRAPESDLSVNIHDVEKQPVQPTRTTTEPPTVSPAITPIENATHLRDFRDRFSGDKLDYLDLALQLEDITGVDAYVIFAKLAIETGLDKAFVKHMDKIRGVREAHGDFQQELANLVTEIRKYGDQLTLVNARAENDTLRLAVEHHGRTEYLKQMPFYKTLDTDDPLKKAIDRGWRDSNEDGVNDLEVSKSKGYAALPEIEQKMVRSWNKHMRVSDPLLVQYMAQQAKTGTFTNKFDEAIYDIPNHSLIAGELAMQHAKEKIPSAHASNFVNGSWEDNIKARNKTAFAVYAPHNMGQNGGPLQLAIAQNPDYANMRLSDTAQLQKVINVINKTMGLRKVSVAELQENANSNLAVFHEGKDTRFGCYEYNITMEIADHLDRYMPVTFEGQFSLWHEQRCGENPIGSIRPVARGDGASNTAELESSLRPKMRPVRGVTLAQN